VFFSVNVIDGILLILGILAVVRAPALQQRQQEELQLQLPASNQ